MNDDLTQISQKLIKKENIKLTSKCKLDLKLNDDHKPLHIHAIFADKTIRVTDTCQSFDITHTDILLN